MTNHTTYYHVSPGGGCDAIQILDGRFAPSGARLALADGAGQLLLYGQGPASIMALAHYDQFYRSDYDGLVVEADGAVVDAATLQPPRVREYGWGVG